MVTTISIVSLQMDLLQPRPCVSDHMLLLHSFSGNLPRDKWRQKFPLCYTLCPCSCVPQYYWVLSTKNHSVFRHMHLLHCHQPSITPGPLREKQSFLAWCISPYTFISEYQFSRQWKIKKLFWAPEISDTDWLVIYRLKED